MIVLENISKTYKSKKAGECQALKKVNIKLGDKGLYFILGKSGSGKSTLLNVLGGLDKPDSGEIFYNNKPISHYTPEEYDNYRNREIGFVFQDYNLLDDFDVSKNVSIAIELQGEKDKTVISKKVSKSLVTVGLSGYEKRKINELSGGQKQRVSIARAIVKDFSTILADEPTGNLDSETGKDIFEILKKISKEKLVIVVSHDRESAETYADGIIEIKDGQTQAYDFIDENTKSEMAYKDNKAKLPLSYSFGIAVNNLFKKKIKVIFTILSSIFLLLFTSGMYIFYDFSSERDIMLSAKSLGVNYFSVTTVEEDRILSGQYGTSYPSLNINDFNVYNLLDEQTSVKYIKQHLIRSAFGNNDIKFHKSETAIVTYQFTSYAGIIDSKQDLEDFGLTLYDNAIDDSDGIYVSDMTILNGFSNGYSFSNGTEDFNQMAGQTISNGKNTHKINGVIKTELIDVVFLDENNKLRTDTEFNERQTCIFKNIASGVFMQKQVYLDKYCYMDDGKVSDNFKWEICSNDNSIEVSSAYKYYNSGAYGSGIITSDGVITTDSFNLTSGEVLLNSVAYNKLFPDDIIELETVSEQIIGGTINLKHLGDKIDVSFKQNSLDRNFAEFGELTIKGVLINDENSAKIHTFENVAEKINPEWQLYASNDAILLYSDDYAGLDKTLSALRSEYSILLYDNSTFNVFYTFETVIKDLARVFLLLLLASLLATVMLLINLISFGVSARTKDIGILRALGTGTQELKKAYIIETLIIAIIAFAFSVAGSIWFLQFMNDSVVSGETVELVWFASTPMMYILMGLQTFLLMPLLALIPLRKITKLNPVDAIKK